MRRIIAGSIVFGASVIATTIAMEMPVRDSMVLIPCIAFMAGAWAKLEARRAEETEEITGGMNNGEI